jgi:hypothetical protein
MKNCNDTIGNRTRDLPACSAVPQPTACPNVLLRLTKAAVPIIASPSPRNCKTFDACFFKSVTKLLARGCCNRKCELYRNFGAAVGRGRRILPSSSNKSNYNSWLHCYHYRGRENFYLAEQLSNLLVGYRKLMLRV